MFGENVMTYDGLHYEKMSDCQQILSQDCSEEMKFRVSITRSRDVSLKLLHFVCVFEFLQYCKLRSILIVKVDFY